MKSKLTRPKFHYNNFYYLNVSHGGEGLLESQHIDIKEYYSEEEWNNMSAFSKAEFLRTRAELDIDLELYYDFYINNEV